MEENKMKRTLAYQYIMNYCLNIWGKLPSIETAPRKNLRNRVYLGTILVSMLAANPLHAEGQAGHPTEGLVVITSLMYGCTQAQRSDLSSHCFVGLVSGTWGVIATKNPYWGTAVGCILGAAKEIYDHQGYGVADEQDFIYTCGAAAISSYGTDSIIKFYKIRNTPVVGIQKNFSLLR